MRPLNPGRHSVVVGKDERLVFFLLIECWNLSLDIFQKYHISIRHNVLSPIDSGRSGPDDFRRVRMYHLK